MPSAPAKLQFVSSLFTSKIFLAQVVTLIATILNAAGYRVLDDPAAQQQVITILDLIVTALLRWLAPTGPVSVAGPVSTPPNRDVQVGTSVVTIASKQEQSDTLAQAVQKLDTGTHSVVVLPPRVPGVEVPQDVVVQKVAP